VDVGEQRSRVIVGGSGERQAKVSPHEAAPAVGTDKVSRVNSLGGGVAFEGHRHAVVVEAQVGQAATELDFAAQLCQAIPQNRLGAPLRQGHGVGVWPLRSWLRGRHRQVEQQRLTQVEPDRGVIGGCLGNAIDDAEVIEHVQGARLQREAPRTDLRPIRLVDDPAGDAPPGEVARQGQPSGPGSHD
jgi:hypothetical protein